MRNKFIASVALGALLMTLMAAAWADQDDNENNADLQATPEELAKAAVLRRWPDATDVDAVDMAADDDDTDAEMMAKDADADDEKDPNEKEAVDVRLMADDGDEGGNWSVSVMFVSNGKKFEALTDDDGKIQYVYETIPTENAPQEIVDAAKAEVKDAEIVYVQKELDETQEEVVTSYIVGIGDKDVRLDIDGKVLEVKDAAPTDEDDDKDDDGGQKMKI